MPRRVAPQPPPPAVAKRIAAGRRLAFGPVWLAFIVCMVAGAAFVSLGTGWATMFGLVLLLAPVVVFGVVALAYYLKTAVEARKRA